MVKYFLTRCWEDNVGKERFFNKCCLEGSMLTHRKLDPFPAPYTKFNSNESRPKHKTQNHKSYRREHRKRLLHIGLENNMMPKPEAQKKNKTHYIKSKSFCMANKTTNKVFKKYFESTYVTIS